jgi:hypothetical protein
MAVMLGDAKGFVKGDFQRFRQHVVSSRFVRKAKARRRFPAR